MRSEQKKKKGSGFDTCPKLDGVQTPSRGPVPSLAEFPTDVGEAIIKAVAGWRWAGALESHLSGKVEVVLLYGPVATELLHHML